MHARRVLTGFILTILFAVGSIVISSVCEASDEGSTSEHSFRPKPASPESRRGRAQFTKNRCNTCHTVGGAGGCLAPPLDGIGARRSEGFLLLRIAKGEKHESEFNSKYGEELMPHLRIAPTDARAVVQYLLTIPEPQKGFKIVGHKEAKPNDQPGDASTGDAASIRRGRLLLSSKGCLACHSIGNLGGSFAPKLDGIGSRRTKEFVKSQMKNADLLTLGVDSEYSTKGTNMPPLNLTDQNVSDLANYLMSLK